MIGNETTWQRGTIRSLLPALLPAVLASMYGWAVFTSTFVRPGSIGFDYLAPGADWMILHGTTRLAMQGHLATTLDADGFAAHINAAYAQFLPRPMSYRPWVYPPSFLVLLWPFGLAGFRLSYVAFQLAGVAVLGAALLWRPEHRVASRWIMAAALACPAASICANDGQCAFLVAGLLVAGFRLLPTRPMLAGAVLGLVSFKPQFGLMIPVVLLATLQWRAIAGAAASSLGLALASVALLGWQPWLWWVDRAAFSYRHAGSEWASYERLWGNSVYACMALLGAPTTLALMAQIAAIAAAAVCVVAAFRRPLGPDMRLTVLLAATLVAAPPFSSYDEELLDIAAALWFASLAAPRMMDAILLLLLWVTPLIGPPILVPAGRFAPLLIFCFIGVALRGPRGTLRLPAALTPAPVHLG